MRYDAKSARLFIGGVELTDLRLNDLEADPVPSPEYEGVTEGPIEFSLTVRRTGEVRAARRSARIWREARRLARGKP